MSGYDFAESVWLLSGTLNQVRVDAQLDYVRGCRRLGHALPKHKKAFLEDLATGLGRYLDNGDKVISVKQYRQLQSECEQLGDVRRQNEQLRHQIAAMTARSDALARREHELQLARLQQPKN